MLMEQNWPQIFGTAEIRPLALGTYAGIVADAAHRGLALDAKLDIRRYLGIYCSQKSYLLALTKGGPRYTLTGEVQGEVTAEDIEAARMKLAALKGKTA